MEGEGKRQLLLFKSAVTICVKNLFPNFLALTDQDLRLLERKVGPRRIL